MLDAVQPPFSQKLIWAGDLQMINGSGELFNHVDTGLPMWTGQGDRNVRVTVGFTAPFGEVPCVSLGLSGIDAAHDQNLRFRMEAVDVTAEGFVIEFVTWGDTHIARASVNWQALGEPLKSAATSRSSGTRQRKS